MSEVPADDAEEGEEGDEVEDGETGPGVEGFEGFVDVLEVITKGRDAVSRTQPFTSFGGGKYGWGVVVGQWGYSGCWMGGH